MEPLVVARRKTLEESFWPKVEVRAAGECWPWLGSRNSKGYGEIVRRAEGGSRAIKATHVSWSLAHGRPFPAGKIACHSCDNPACVNPAHIWPGTHAENAVDKINKGRAAVQLPKAACVNGHELSGSNLFLDTNGNRRCRTCARAAGQRSKSKIKERIAA